MKKLTLLLCTVLLMAGCSPVRLISDYDEVIDKGITDFAVQLNTHVKNMGDLGGKPEGTYDANITKYNELDSKIDVMIARASANSGGVSCKLQQETYDKIKLVFKDTIPAQIQNSSEAKQGNINACNTRLLELVKAQVSQIRDIHQNIDKCSSGGSEVSCLRRPTSKMALEIANQSINAVAVVETAKKAAIGN